MLDVDMIMDQKRSPGLIENPCRDALIALASRVPADQAIVELGSFKGRSTAHLALGTSLGNGAPVHAFDPWEDGEMPEGYQKLCSPHAEYLLASTREQFEAHMKATGADEYVTPHRMTGYAGARGWQSPLPKVGLLFHDALHDYESVFEDLKAWLPKMAPQAVVVLHDTDDVRFGVVKAAEDAFTRTKQLASKWAWDAREIHPWAKNEGRAPEARRRGFIIVRTR